MNSFPCKTLNKLKSGFNNIILCFSIMPSLHSRNGILCQKLLTFCIFSIISSVICTPPDDPIKCSSGNRNCTVTNCYGRFADRSICKAAEVAYPNTEAELIAIVARATRQGRKMKVATSTSHSIPKLVCPDGANGVLISTKNLNGTINIDKSSMTITVESGMLLRKLINESANAGLAIAYVPYWWGLTVGGMLGTGAHGSTLWASGSSVHDYVLKLRIVTPAGPEEGYAKVRTLESGHPEFDAAKVSLGVLGVISQVTLQLQPLFKRSITHLEKNDSDLGDQVLSFGRQHEFADLRWYPSQKKVVYRVDDRVPNNTNDNGLYELMGFRSTPSLFLAIIRSTEETQEALGDEIGKCINAGLTRSILQNGAYGLTNDGRNFRGYPVVGYNNRLQSSGTCLNSPQDLLLSACPWDPRIKGLSYFQTGISIALTKVKGFIQDVQKLVALSPRALCGTELYDGILMRYVTASSAYLGKQEDALEFDITYYRSQDPTSPRLNQDILEEIEQMAVVKYGGLPHWGKNRNLAFHGAINKYRNAAEFLKVKQFYDPLGLFSSEWTDQILGLKNGTSVLKEGCALEGLCICSEDIHCAPDDGYFCGPGIVYIDARVCTKRTRKLEPVQMISTSHLEL